jgi:hypothetical protein
VVVVLAVELSEPQPLAGLMLQARFGEAEGARLVSVAVNV